MWRSRFRIHDTCRWRKSKTLFFFPQLILVTTKDYLPTCLDWVLTNLSLSCSTRQFRNAVCPTRVVMLRGTEKSKYGCDEKFWLMLLLSRRLFVSRFRYAWYGSETRRRLKRDIRRRRRRRLTAIFMSFFGTRKIEFKANNRGALAGVCHSSKTLWHFMISRAWNITLLFPWIPRMFRSKQSLT